MHVHSRSMLAFWSDYVYDTYDVLSSSGRLILVRVEIVCNVIDLIFVWQYVFVGRETSRYDIWHFRHTHMNVHIYIYIEREKTFLITLRDRLQRCSQKVLFLYDFFEKFIYEMFLKSLFRFVLRKNRRFRA